MSETTFRSTSIHQLNQLINNKPANVAVIKVAIAPPITALIPRLAIVDFLLGARGPNPPIWIAIELKLAKPHKA